MVYKEKINLILMGWVLKKDNQSPRNILKYYGIKLCLNRGQLNIYRKDTQLSFGIHRGLDLGPCSSLLYKMRGIGI